MIAESPTTSPRKPRPWLFVCVGVLVPLALAVLVWWNDREFDRTDVAQRLARASYETQLSLGQLVARLEQAETSQRGFVLTGSPEFLRPYAPARAAARADLDGLSSGFADEPAQQTRLVALAALVDRKFAEMDAVIALRRSQGLAIAAQRVKDGEGRRLMDRLRGATSALQQQEEAITRARIATLQGHVAATRRMVFGAVVATSALLLVALLLLWRQRRQRYQADVLAFDSAQRNRTILDSTIDPIVIINPSGTIESINAAASRLLGYRQDEMLRRDVGTIMRLHDDGGSFYERIGLEDGVIARPYLSNLKIRHRDGHHIPVDVALGVMPLPDGDHIVASVRDISERKRIEGLKDELVSTISHELRTPLTSVVGALGLLRSGSTGELPTGAARLIEIAENNSRRLIRLINDMLDIDRMQSGQLQIDMQPVDLADVAVRACRDAIGLGAARNVGVVCTPPDGPAPVTGDADRLLQVVLNLVSNAIRVSPDGAEVRIGIISDRIDKRVTLTVDDSGPGVPRAFRDRIFRRFERAAESQGVGTGLGLAISREIVHRHDGRIWFEDRPEGGTRFAFTIDMRATARTPASATGAVDRVLICEDDPGVAALLGEMVEGMGYGVEVVPNAAAARNALARDTFAALLLDLQLPGENGLALARSLRNADGTSTLPIIVVSGTLQGDGSEPVPVDLIDWIAKPIDHDRLARAIGTAVERSGAERPIVLHLDDDPDVLEITASLLGGEARLLKVSNLASARALLEHQSPDVAILDMHLPDGTGLDLLPVLVDDEGLAIPTIIYSAYDVSAEAAARVDAVLIKSRRSLPDLRATLRRIVREQRGAKE